jgi:hypothetical protein
MMQMGKLHNETAILEVCDWEEDKVDMLLENLNNMLMDLNSPLTENLQRFCENQDYISEYNRQQLYGLLEQTIVLELKDQARIEKEYEN